MERYLLIFLHVLNTNFIVFFHCPVNAKARNCVSKITVCSFTSGQSALAHWKTFLGGFLLIFAFRSQSARTIPWSEILGMEMQD